jgi:hypothetical protein
MRRNRNVSDRTITIRKRLRFGFRPDAVAKELDIPLAVVLVEYKRLLADNRAEEAKKNRPKLTPAEYMREWRRKQKVKATQTDERKSSPAKKRASHLAELKAEGYSDEQIRAVFGK